MTEIWVLTGWIEFNNSFFIRISADGKWRCRRACGCTNLEGVKKSLQKYKQKERALLEFAHLFKKLSIFEKGKINKIKLQDTSSANYFEPYKYNNTIA